MTAVALAGADRARRAGLSAGAERIRRAMLWLVGASSGIVLIEPSPYEGIVTLAMILFAATGLKVRRGHLPLIVLLALLTLAYAVGVVPVLALENTVKWTAVSCFMGVTSLFFAFALAEHTRARLDAIIAGYIAGAAAVSFIAVAAYLHLIPGADIFIVLGGRAKATFKDPNVLGAYLILPAIVIMSRLLLRDTRHAFGNIAVLMLISAAVLLTFSRGAWAVYAGATVLMALFSFLTARSDVERVRIATMALIGLLLLGIFVGGILSLGKLGAFFEERASLLQSYDSGPLGRFGRHVLGALLIFDHPIGIGPLQFTRYFPEDPHNSFLDAFMAGGWLGGLSYLVLMLVTVTAGLRIVIRRSPWQRDAIAFYATFLALLGESYIIDVEHWRHLFLIIGVIWGLVAIGPSAPARRAAAATMQPPQA